MSNARNLADLLSPGNTIVAAAKLAGVEDKIILNGTDGSSTNAGDNILLDASASGTDVGENFLFEDFTDDGSAVLETSQKVLQVVTSTTSTEVANSTTSDVATGLTAAITPSDSSSSIFATATIPIQIGSNAGNIVILYSLKRGSTVIATTPTKVNVNGIVQLHESVSISRLDEPNTTSEITYSVTFKETSQTNRYGSSLVCTDNTTATLTLMEISG